MVDSPEAATAVADSIDGPVVMKIVSPEIVHKSDIGGVEVGVPPEAIADTYRPQTVSFMSRLAGKARLSGPSRPGRHPSRVPIRSTWTRPETRAFPASGPFEGRETFTL
ncbi:MAG: acetate--CoA ligase family protein [Pirellulaceae bacterium]